MANQQLIRPRKAVKKVALTKKIEDSEKQLIVGTRKNVDSPLVQGQFVSYRCGEHYSIHGSKAVELSDSEVVSVAPSSVIITLLLKGEIEFGYNNLNFALNAEHSPQAIIVNLDKPTNFRRKINAGNQVTKLNIMMSPQWMKQLSGNLADNMPFLEASEAFQNIQVTTEMVSLASKVIENENNPSFLNSLATEITVQQLILLVCEQLESRLFQNAFDNKVHDRDQKINDTIHYIESHLNQEISLETIAEHMMMSVSNLQRRFKQELGVTTAVYIRQRRLEVAKQHIERGSMTITEAAYEAGYHHPSNFSNAFKKAFGYSPSGFLDRNENLS